MYCQDINLDERIIKVQEIGHLTEETSNGGQWCAISSSASENVLEEGAER